MGVCTDQFRLLKMWAKTDQDYTLGKMQVYVDEDGQIQHNNGSLGGTSLNGHFKTRAQTKQIRGLVKTQTAESTIHINWANSMLTY